MSKTKHTPGPWMALTGEVTGILDQASVVHDPGKNKEYVFIAETADIDETLPIDVRIANARLIAAAPELLESLKAVVKIADRNTDEFVRARAIIAQAEGRNV
jgi:hypothetical protein